VRDARRGGDRVFALKREAGEQTFRLVVRAGVDGTDRVAVDPARWRTPAEAASIDYYAPSPNGRLVAVAISLGGSESSTLHVVDVDSGTEVGTPIPRADFGFAAWRFDSAVLWYLQAREGAPGADPADKYRDGAVWMRQFRDAGSRREPLPGAALPLPVGRAGVRPHRRHGCRSGRRHADARRLAGLVVGAGRRGTASREVTVFAAPLSSVRGPDTPWRKVVDRAQGVEDVDLRGEWLYLRTSEGAPRYRLLRWSLNAPGAYRAPGAEVVLPEGRAIFAGFAVAKDAIYAHVRDVGAARVVRLEFNVKLAKSAPARRVRGKPAPAAMPKHSGVARATAIELPFAGTLSERVVDPLHAGALLRLAGWTEPPGYFAVAPGTGTLTRTSILPRSPVSFADLAVTQVRREPRRRAGAAHDRRGRARRAQRDGPGDPRGLRRLRSRDGAGVPSVAQGVVRPGGIYAVAHARAAANSADWHLAGQKAAKRNTWLDLVACAEHLAKAGHASPARIALRGASAGGLAVVNAMAARPALFRAVVSEVGFHDAIRGELAATGPANVEEFGSVATPEGFRALLAMSAYANAADGVAYPAVLFTAGYNDPRVLPWDPGKMAARLQAIAAAPGGSGRPVLLRTDFAGGHGLDATLDQIVDETADVLAFLLWQTGAPGFALPGPTSTDAPKD
jgi:prolyl oligopeptidase